jgi:very-short-patch-repair endonuclease
VTRYNAADNFGDINGPFLGSHAISEGLLTKNQLRSLLVRRLFQNVYLPTGYPPTHEVRCKAAALVVPREAVLTGCSAAVIRGFQFVLDDDPVEFVVPEAARFVHQRGMHIRRSIRGDIESEPWREIGIATPLRMTMDILTNTRLHRSFPRVVGMLDALLHAGVIERDALGEYLERRHDNGIVRARKAFAFSDGRAESIPESEVRVWLRLGDIPTEPQLEIYQDGIFLGRLDLAIEEIKLAVEYDGAWHLEGDQPALDAARRAAIEAAGWEFIIVTKDDLLAPRRMIARVRDALRRRSAMS